MTPEQRQALDAVAEHGGNLTAAARTLGLGRSCLWWRYRAALAAGGSEEIAKPQPTETIEQQGGNGDDLTLTYKGEKIATPDELVAAAGVDLAIWEIADFTIKHGEVAGKARQGQADDGRWKADKLWKTSLRWITVKLRRKAPKPIQEGIRELLATMRRPKLARVKRPALRSEPHLLEVSLSDAHFGKRCWGEMVGSDYDLEIAEGDYVAAVDDLLGMVKGWSIDQVLFPFGNDFFQCNNWLGTTERGTVVDSVDDRFQRVFRVGCRAVQYAVERCREIADVEVIWIPGNHDPETSWYLVEWLAAVFRDDPHVSIDNGPKTRKYRSYGPVLLGYNHGHRIKHDKFPLIMATDVPDLWGASTARHWRLGHYHKKAQTAYLAHDTYNGVHVQVLPSLSGTDRWHYEEGYVNGTRTAEVYLWGKQAGYVGHFSVGARSDAESRSA